MAQPTSWSRSPHVRCPVAATTPSAPGPRGSWCRKDLPGQLSVSVREPPTTTASIVKVDLVVALPLKASAGTVASPAKNGVRRRGPSRSATTRPRPHCGPRSAARRAWRPPCATRPPAPEERGARPRPAPPPRSPPPKSPSPLHARLDERRDAGAVVGCQRGQARGRGPQERPAAAAARRWTVSAWVRDRHGHTYLITVISHRHRTMGAGVKAVEHVAELVTRASPRLRTAGEAAHSPPPPRPGGEGCGMGWTRVRYVAAVMRPR